MFVKDGEYVNEGDLLMRFDTTQAAAQKSTFTRLIELEERDAQNRRQIFEQRLSVIQKKLATAEVLSNELESLVEAGGYQKMQFLRQLDEVFELKSQISNTSLR